VNWPAWQHFILLLKLPVFVIGLLAVLYQLSRAPRDPELRLIALCLTAALGSGLFELDWAAHAFVAHTSLAVAKLLQNLLLFALFFLLISFFLHAAGRRRQIRHHAVVVIIAGTALTSVWLFTPPSKRGAPYLASAHSGWIWAFYFIGLAYLGLATVAAARAAWHYSLLTEPRIALGLRLIVAALILALVIPFERVTALALWACGAAMPPSADHVCAGLQSLSIPIFVAGFVAPAAISRALAWQRWRRHLREYHHLAPLWNSLHEVFPEDALNRRANGSWLDAVNVRSIHRRCHRRAIECRDGLVRLSPYWPSQPPDTETDHPSTPEQQARFFGAALRALREGATPERRARLVLAPPIPDRDCDIAQLTALSLAWGQLAPRTSAIT
jgi:hypothetical protein